MTPAADNYFITPPIFWNFRFWPFAAGMHVPWNVGDQGSGLVVLNVSFVAHDP
jgi:hypothetical protein